MDKEVYLSLNNEIAELYKKVSAHMDLKTKEADVVLENLTTCGLWLRLYYDMTPKVSMKVKKADVKEEKN